jgi:hypothetical protein
MHDSERHRRNGADCVRATFKAREPHYQGLYVLMAQSWLSLARQGDVTGELLASWNVV